MRFIKLTGSDDETLWIAVEHIQVILPSGYDTHGAEIFLAHDNDPPAVKETPLEIFDLIVKAKDL